MMMSLRLCLPLCLLVPGVAQEPAAPAPAEPSSAVAILVDRATQKGAAPELRQYQAAIEGDGLKAWAVARAWARPEEVRDCIRALRKRQPRLEGVVLVGRIPVPMLRDAQHLTSAFKMDQRRFPRRRSSVPSDRFYEDLDLRFDYLGQDEKEPDLFYYSLRGDSPQRVEKELYSGRIPLPEAGEKGIRAVAEFLAKAARRKRAGARPLRRALVYSGHGYHSNCLNAWRWQLRIMEEQFPQLHQPGAHLSSYYHLMGSELKARVCQELQHPALQLAIFHAHGAPAAQYLLGEPDAATVPAKIEDIQRSLRLRLRRAERRKKSAAEEQVRLMERLRVPHSWFAGASDEKVQKTDEAWAAKQDLTPADIARIAPAAPVVVFDECFNGRFIDRPCVATAYLYGRGETVVAMANTVNVLQDIWSDHRFGLLNHGWRIGEVHRQRPYLESHLIGDPTFRFAPAGARPIPNTAPMRAWQRRGADVAEWVRTYQQSSSALLRMEALRVLARSRGPEFEKLLLLAVRDPYELIRRKAAFLLGDVGHGRFALPLLRLAMEDPSRRTAFNARNALQKLDPADLARAREQYPNEVGTRLDFDPAWRKLMLRFTQPPAWRAKDLQTLQDPKATEKKRIGAVRSFRNYRVHHHVPVLLKVVGNPANPEPVRVAVLEALGWFQYSYQRGRILELCDRLLAEDATPESVRREAKKTATRLQAGPNAPLTP